MSAPKPSDSSSKPFVFSWRRLILHSAILSIGVLLGLLAWIISKPQSVRFHETKSEEYRLVSVTQDILIALDNSSSIAVTDNNPIVMELFKGNIYFDVKKDTSSPFNIKIGETHLEAIGTRFSVRMRQEGSHILSVAEGQVKIHTASGFYLVNALEQANFNDFNISNHRLINTYDVAPWFTDQ